MMTRTTPTTAAVTRPVLSSPVMTTRARATTGMTSLKVMFANHVTTAETATSDGE
jgi:hypothetical protein